MLPEHLVLCSASAGVLTPHWYLARDHPWLRELLDTVVSYEGRPLLDLDQRLAEAPAPGVALRRARLAVHVLLRARGRDLPRPVIAPSRVRAAVFTSDARGASLDRDAALGRAARELGIAVSEVERLLLADQRGEQRVRLPWPLPSADSLAAEINLALAAALVARAFEVRIQLHGNARAVIRHARLVGLLATIVPDGPGPEEPGVAVELSGPLALFHRTRIYGRALAGLLPILPWCRRFRLRAKCRLRGQDGLLELRTGDPIPAAAERPRHDSEVERRFAADFVRLAPEWDLLREPEPIAISRGLVFPDFALIHRRDPTRPRWLLEIAGFWTPAYVAEKLARLREVAGAGSATRFVLMP